MRFENQIGPQSKLLYFPLAEIWRYRDLLVLLVRRDVVTVYKQTILGPLWYFIQPLFTSLIFTLLFNNLAGIETGSVPPFLFNLASITVWNYFSTCLTTTSDVFKTNASLFGKVYFPRIIMPLSIVVSNLFKFLLQFAIFVGFYLYYIAQGSSVSVSVYAILLPIVLLNMALLSLGLGMFISALVTKYRDLSFLISFGVQLLMYVSAVTFPLAMIREKLPNYAWIVDYNPLAYIIEHARYMLLSTGTFSWISFLGCTLCSLLVFIFGSIIFNATERSFIDTV
ncbi:ABC transporter permease [Flavobacterium sp.]|uniref:ABC transporter permease n=1 Tax=Flavobacterium sp. TaxID=239 RepID=UPI0026092A53|nr:ABC transporter permease [Flavobacterium sp.]